MRLKSSLLALSILPIFAMSAHAGSVVTAPYPVVGNATFNPNESGLAPFGTYSGAGYSITGNASPSISINTNTYINSSGNDTSGSGDGTLNYFYEVEAPASVGAGVSVPVTITGKVSASWTVDGSAEAVINYYGNGNGVTNYGTGEIQVYPAASQATVGSSGSTSARLNASYDVITDTVEEISMFVYASAVTGGANYSSMASASADPQITLSPTLLAEGYNIVFSPNLATTPLPSTWLTLLSGLAGFGFLAHRRTKRTAAAIESI
jgi:hypothetical protein